MGYMLSSLAQLPIDDEVDLYIFVINGGWRGGSHEIIEQNFSKLAEEIGPRAVIAKGFNKSWSSDVSRKYLGKDHSELFGLLPALLITDTHPDQLTDQSMRLLIPLKDANAKFGNFDTFFDSLTKFAREKDTDFLEHFHEKEESEKSAWNMLELKPNIWGIGININEILERFSRSS
jgi:hypothetical protein